MSKQGEIKRISLTTISTTTSATAFPSKSDATAGTSSSFSRFGIDFMEPPPPIVSKPVIQKSAKTIRLNLKLFESDSEKYPEFNCAKLIHLEKKKNKLLKQKTSNGTSDPFSDNNEDVERVAKELERKYGSSYVSSRSRNKPNNAREIAMGYDITDSFIDNSEAFDEIVPDELETIEGGFYINCGVLEFKNLNRRTGMSRTDEIIKMPDRPKKRALSTSSECSSSSSDDDDGDSENDDSENDDNEGGDEDGDDDSDESDSESESESPDNEEEEAVNAGKLKVKPLIQDQEVSKKNTSDKKSTIKNVNTATSSTSSSPKPNPSENNSDLDERARQKNIKTTTIKDMLKAKRDSFLKSQNGSGNEPKPTTINGELKCTSTEGDGGSTSESDITESATEQDEAGKRDYQNFVAGTDSSEKFRAADTKLPSLDANFIECIKNFKEQAISRNGSGKKLAFDEKLSTAFLKLDDRLLTVDKTERNMVFAHLEFHIQLPKYFLLRKSKQLRVKEEKHKNSRTIIKLRKCVSDVMPQAASAYGVELRKLADLQSNIVNTDEPPKMPLKKFPWNAETREALFEVYNVRKDSFAVLGKRKDSLESFISTYLKEKVLDIWPSGWMRFDELQREIDKLRNVVKKPKKFKKENQSEKKGKEFLSYQRPPQEVALSSGPTINIKRLDDLTITASRSVPTTDAPTPAAVCSSSNLLKRKKLDECNTKLNHQTNNKICKTSVIEPSKANTNLLQQTTTAATIIPISTMANQMNSGVLDLASPSKQMYNNFLTAMANLPQFQQAQMLAAATQSMVKHSKTTSSGVNPQLITVDGSQSTSDILKTSKQLAATSIFCQAGASVSNTTAFKETPRMQYSMATSSNNKQKSTTAKNAYSQNGNESSESDSVEIISVFAPVKNLLPLPCNRRNTGKITETATNSNTMLNKNFNMKDYFVTKNSVSTSGASSSKSTAHQARMENATKQLLKQTDQFGKHNSFSVQSMFSNVKVNRGTPPNQ